MIDWKVVDWKREESIGKEREKEVILSDSTVLITTAATRALSWYACPTFEKLAYQGRISIADRYRILLRAVGYGDERRTLARSDAIAHLGVWTHALEARSTMPVETVSSRKAHLQWL